MKKIFQFAFSFGLLGYSVTNINAWANSFTLGKGQTAHCKAYYLSNWLDCTSPKLKTIKNAKFIYVFGTGFDPFQAELIQSAEQMFTLFKTTPADVFVKKYESQLIYKVFTFEEDSPEKPLFKGKVMPHPVRGRALTYHAPDLDESVQNLVNSGVETPQAVVLIYNDFQENVTANASPPTQFGKSYGISRITRWNLKGHYVPVHELAHAFMNWLDEYIEPGFENMSIAEIDSLTTLVLSGNPENYAAYDVKLSEIIAANGNDNVDVVEYPSRVETENGLRTHFSKEGGMFFGRGVYHSAGKNLMGGIIKPGGVEYEHDDGFDWRHSEPQKQLMEYFFSQADSPKPPRVNDRIRTAGPIRVYTEEPPREVLLFDADKNHTFHPTTYYDVEFKWKSERLEWCAEVNFFCVREYWSYASKRAWNKRESISLHFSQMFQFAEWLRSALCHFGVSHVQASTQQFDICVMSIAELAHPYVPALEIAIPYQKVRIPSDVPATNKNIYWRFRTHNGMFSRSGNTNDVSGFTNWAKVATP